MSHQDDVAVSDERVRRHAEMLRGAERLEARAHALIIEAHALRGLAARFAAHEGEKSIA